ncbi:MAG: Hcp family type VI secretion system effector [Brucella intermedia]
MAIYLQIEGIKGDATQGQHKDWIEITTIDFGVMRHLNTRVGGISNREATEPSLNEIVVTKNLDLSTTDIFHSACSGTVGKTVIIHFVTTGASGRVYLEVKLDNVLISNHHITSAGERPLERVHLNFTKIELKNTYFDGTNKEQSPKIVSFDLGIADAA